MGNAVELNLEAGAVEWLPERRFREEDLKLFWFHDSLHNNPPITPMGASTYHWPRASQYAAEHLSLPTSRGFDFRLFYGRIYPAPLPITDPEEIEARAAVFQQRVWELITRWPDYYQACVREWLAMLEYLQGIKREVLPLPKLLAVLDDSIRVSMRSWEIHFECMYTCFTAYLAFEQICRKHGIGERDMRIFLQGFDTKMYEVDRGLWRLAVLARDLALGDKFATAEKMEDLERQLQQCETGRVWLDQFRDFLHRYGRRTTAALFDPAYKTWLEDPYPVLFTVRTYVMRGAFDFEEHAKRIVEERDRFIAATAARLPREEKEEFLRALKEAQNTYPFNEDHNFYVEQWAYAELRYSILEAGRRLAAYHILAAPEDVFFLTYDELRSLLEALLLNERLGVQEGKLRYTQMVADRKRIWQRLHEVQPPPFIGSVPETRLEDPVFIKIWGHTDEVIRGKVRPRAGVSRKIEGFPGAPGVAEGVARVISGYEGFSEVMPDDILIAPFTTPAWTPLFSKIKAVATDSGGMLAHAAICAREYGIPAVVGTITRGQKATEAVRTGDWVRVDGTKGIVEVLVASGGGRQPG